MIKPKQVLLSLAEPVGVLKQTISEYAQYIANTNNGRANGQLSLLQSNNALNYNAGEYMSLLVHEIVNSAVMIDSNKRFRPSTKLLIQQGLDSDTAVELSLNIFKLTIDAIAAHIPELTFDNLEGYSMDFCNLRDVVITFPVDYND